MSNLVFQDNSEKISVSGSQFEGFETIGNKHLCIKTGVGSSDVKKFGLTSTPINDKYSKMKMRISTGGGAVK